MELYDSAEKICNEHVKVVMAVVSNDDNSLFHSEFYAGFDNSKEPLLFAVAINTNEQLLGVFQLEPDGKIRRYSRDEVLKSGKGPCDAAVALYKPAK